jgi:hypothetical protein
VGEETFEALRGDIMSGIYPILEILLCRAEKYERAWKNMV